MFVELVVCNELDTQDARPVWVNAARVLLFEADFSGQLTFVQLTEPSQQLVVRLSVAEVARRLNGVGR